MYPLDDPLLDPPRGAPMRIAEPDLHEATRKQAEALLPPDKLNAFTKREQKRVERARRLARVARG